VGAGEFDDVAGELELGISFHKSFVFRFFIVEVTT
jgi:hypothetical protein